MGQLVDGRWQPDRLVSTDSSGRFHRAPSPLRNWITADGRAGPTGEGGFAAQAGRYHLYVSYACPFAHRALIVRSLMGLEETIGVSFTHWLMGEDGWSFAPASDSIPGDRLFGARHLYEIYQRSDPQFTGRVTVPVLYDRERDRIVSNDSGDIMRMLAGVFAKPDETPEFIPAGREARADELGAWLQERVNGGVYRAGFATTQEAYEEAVTALFEALDALEQRLSQHDFLFGNEPSEPDWRLLPTLLRLDLVYHGHFKCNLRRLADYPALSAYARTLYRWPGIAATCNFEHAKRHYFASHRHLNPAGIVPLGPDEHSLPWADPR
ncbi:glutathione S-transferase family protein [Qipengyuania qiaonensis]|uniref:Glutathione S-transferase C-terminal domain-containing protein n=1 Tax=Qipengyuania qiaonensis TaxID=2867240 RepID=A0ABS7J316_9SPHN|nr:glutathione S-transferase C-terminal domain-containing protein [Qipengyuania qiaonensis]MBX7481720.1 glutathione S-transferase C-terminal domain-containing protein [Qipengyuania qiaonensis]